MLPCMRSRGVVTNDLAGAFAESGPWRAAWFRRRRCQDKDGSLSRSCGVKTCDLHARFGDPGELRSLSEAVQPFPGLPSAARADTAAPARPTRCSRRAPEPFPHLHAGSLRQRLRFGRSSHRFPWLAPWRALPCAPSRPIFIIVPGNRDYGDKRARNKRIGPGGGTRRLHQSSLVGGGGGRNRIDERVKVIAFAR